MEHNNQCRIGAITLLGFGLFFTLNKRCFSDLYHLLCGFIDVHVMCFLIAYVIIGLPIFIATYFLTNRDQFFESLGLQSNILKGAGVTLLTTLPMLIGYATSFEFNAEITFNEIVTGSIYAAFFEELYYRGFLFGMLYRYTRLGFIPSIILGALIFGSVHIFQSEDLGTMIGIFFTTFMGAGLFAWLYAEWEFNLWVPIFLHFFMNLFWDLFAVSGNALGGVNANVFRIATIVLVIVGTVIYKLNNDGLQVNKSTIWMKEK